VVRDRASTKSVKSVTAAGTGDAHRRRMTRFLIVLLVACSSSPNPSDGDDDYCPNASCIISICECGSDSCAGVEPTSCGSDAECGSGERCTSEINDTQQCSVTCDGGSGCPDGYFCQMYVP
jgi:hypothetical protein